MTDTLATFDGHTVEPISFPEHSIDLDRMDGLLTEPGGPRSVRKLRIVLTYAGLQPLFLRVELKDTLGGGRFRRFRLRRSRRPQVLDWNFRSPSAYQILGDRDLDLHAAKVVSLVIERKHVTDGIENPLTGSFAVQRLAWLMDRPDTQPTTDGGMLDLVERRTLQYFLDWSSRKPASFGIPQDRSTFGDLLTVGGIGFALPAYIIGAERGWISRADAMTRTLSVLRLLADQSGFGSERTGRIGHRGWFYHFLGVDGRRKLNFDFPESSQNEALQTVELSTIDTALAVMGVLAAQSYFAGASSDEVDIQSLAQSIYDRVDWPFMVEPTSQQLYLGWKPQEEQEGPPFAILDAAGEGHYSGTPGHPATLDYYTDEATIATLLALGSTTHPLPPAVYCAWQRVRDAAGFVKSYPGSLFTYFFLQSFLDTRNPALLVCPQDPPQSWYENSRHAFLHAIAYAEANPRGFLTYGPNAWGISAAEVASDRYKALGVPSIALNPQPDEDGTVTYYGMVSAVSFGEDLRHRVLQGVRAAWQRGHWHPRFGLPDAFHFDISQADLTTEPGTINQVVRRNGPWVQRALFAIDQGPMLLHLENARSGLLWSLLGQNPNIQRALTRLQTPAQIVLEGEEGAGNGQVMPRSNASRQKTVWLHAGESRTLSLQLPVPAAYRLKVRYSNDNFGPLEVVTIHIDGSLRGQFTPQDTGDGGSGWNNFLWSDALGPFSFSSGFHEVTLTVSGGDGFGVEIDVVQLDLAV